MVKSNSNQDEIGPTSLQALQSRPIQSGAIVVAVALASMATPTTMPDAYRVGYGVGVVLFALILATLVLIWRKRARGFIPILALVLSVPLTITDHFGSSAGDTQGMIGSGLSTAVPADEHVPTGTTGDWTAQGQIRSYWFSLSEAADGDVTGTVEYTQPNGPRERSAVTGSRLGGGVLIRFEETDHAPWVANGQFIDDNTIRAYLSIGRILAMPLTLRRELD